jgi:hypothetical protein
MHLAAKVARAEIGLREKIAHRVLPEKIADRGRVADIVPGRAVDQEASGADRVQKAGVLPRVVVTIAARADGRAAAGPSNSRRKSRSKN